MQGKQSSEYLLTIVFVWYCSLDIEQKNGVLKCDTWCKTFICAEKGFHKPHNLIVSNRCQAPPLEEHRRMGHKHAPKEAD